MKFSILSGAYINAGDFLIVERTIELLRYIYPNCEIIEYRRDKNLEEDLVEINKTDALILAGGPAYMIDMYPNIIPLVENLDKIKTKIVTIGLGWYGAKTDIRYIKNYIFTDKTKKLLERIEKDSNVLTCRDWYSIRALQINKFEKVLMTGCPAWYNINKINELQLRNKEGIIKKICISDPAKENNIYQSLEVVKLLKNKYKNAEIYFVFHRKTESSKAYSFLWEELQKINIKLVDITGSMKGFAIYDDCDLHVGYRVHAHIYNLSNRNISVLLEEDGRGAGVNEALGIKGINIYTQNKYILYFIRKLRSYRMKSYLTSKLRSTKETMFELETILDMMEVSNYIQYKTVFFNLKLYYKNMEKHIKSIMNKGEE